MKKLLIVALFILGMCNASAFGMAHEIILTELYSVMPLDDPGDEVGDVRPNPNLFRAFIDGNQLSVGAHADIPAYVEVINQETGEVVVEEEFEGETEISVEDVGSYTIQIYSSNSVMTGEFEVE